MSNYSNTEPFFFPPINFEESRKHYGQDISDQEIIDKVYGGKNLEKLYKSITFKASQSDILNLCATITLNPAENSPVESLILRNVSLSQFLVAGLPKAEWFKNGFIEPNRLWKILKEDNSAIFTDDEYYSY